MDNQKTEFQVQRVFEFLEKTMSQKEFDSFLKDQSEFDSCENIIDEIVELLYYLELENGNLDLQKYELYGTVGKEFDRLKNEFLNNYNK